MTTFTGELGQYKLVETSAGDFTLWSEHFREHCHSMAGAIGETNYNFIEGCKLGDKLKKLDETIPLRILEVGFGTGCGWMETKKFLRATAKHNVHFLSLEIEPALISWAQKQYASEVDDSYPCFKDLKLIKNEKDYDLWEAEKERSRLTILRGDASTSLQSFLSQNVQLEHSFDAIFQDAFSPGKNPVLWEEKFFSTIRKLVKADGVLSTYSVSASVKKNLEASGWKCQERSGFAHKRASLVAIPQYQ